MLHKKKKSFSSYYKNAYSQPDHKIFTFFYEIKCTLSIKESNFDAKNRSKFSHLLTARANWADPSLPYGQPESKKTAFYDSREVAKNFDPPSPTLYGQLFVTFLLLCF